MKSVFDSEFKEKFVEKKIMAPGDGSTTSSPTPPP